ncbi:cache domain-containing protein [Curvibacter sp. CHRR-16]|uniref:cache domain-containing protein n=1 Tax=Curvibacter sp. CHRR-16 TaxID=2835872 RepID=UPI001BDB0DE4|nr:cache domain-containing protein [Curvibacter sp. CHRR-16]MBT0569831.1 cache domain-containing protein [Curvibacter sp. CHRR-16]
MFRSARFVISAFLALGLTMTTAWADARKDAQEQTLAALAHIKKVGPDQAFKDFNTEAQWKNKGLNVNVVEFTGLVRASSLNDKLVGKNTLEAKDPNGKEFVKEFIKMSEKTDGGWVDYMFINPETKKLEERSMYVRKIPSFNGFVGIAITK